MFNKKSKVFLGIFSMLFVLVFVSGCQKTAVQDLDLNNDENVLEEEVVDENKDEPLIGGDKDGHGCLIAAGYSWCQVKNKCLRTWEEECKVAEPKEEVRIIFENLDWKQYSNKLLDYSIDYPTIVNVMGNDLDQHVEFTGPLSNNEWWPRISVSHYSSNFYRPSEGSEVSEWVKPFPGYKLGKEISIADLDTVHYVQAKTPQAWAADYYYFIKDNQLYNITIIHGNDQEDWQLYDRILDSFVFKNTIEIE